MKTKFLACLLSIIALCLLCSACSSPATADGTWYSVTDATMYNFKNGEITVAGVVVGQYDNQGDIVVLSLIEDSSNRKLYITSLDGVEVLADVREGEGNIYFCRGLENAEKMIADEEKKKEDQLQDFADYIGANLYGFWVPKENQQYSPDCKSIEIRKDGTVVYTLNNGTTIERQLVYNSNGTIKAANLRIANYGWSPAIDTPAIDLFTKDIATGEEYKFPLFAYPDADGEASPILAMSNGWYVRVE